MRRFLGSVAVACSVALVGSGLSPAAAAPEPDAAPPAVEGQVTSRPDAVSAQVSARATGRRVEDLSQRTATEQVFANPDGSWTSETSTGARFAEKNGVFVPISDLGTLESAGETVTGAGTRLSIADGADTPGDGPTEGSVPLATLEGTGEDKGTRLELGWEGSLPAPEVSGNVATYTDGVEVPVQDAPAQAADTVDAEAPVRDAPASTADTVDAEVTVEPTRSGFSHRTVLEQAPEGDVELRFPLRFSKGLKVVRDEGTGDLRAVDAGGETVFFAPAPTMWDAKIDEASGLPAAETRVDTAIETVDGVQILVLKVAKEWLQDPARQYPVTIDPTWTSGASDTWVQADVPGSKAGDTELRVGTFNGGSLKSRSFLQFSSTALTGKQITKAELRMHNYYSYSCTSSPIEVQRLTTAWVSTDVRWTAQPTHTTSGEGSNNVSKGYSASCAAGHVYYPITPIAQYWADNPTKNFGVRLVAQDETNNYSWKRYRSANYVTGANDPVEPTFIVTYNSYPDTASGVSFGSGQSSTDSTGKLWVRTKTPTLGATVTDPDGGKVKAEFDVSGATTVTKLAGSSVDSKTLSTAKPTLVEGTHTAKAWANDGTLRSKAAGTSTTFTVDSVKPATPTITSDAGYTNNSWKSQKPTSNRFTFASNTDAYQFRYSLNGAAGQYVTATGGTASVDWNPSGANTIRVVALDRAGNETAATEMAFGNGPVSLTAPKAGITSTDSFAVAATGPNISNGGTPTATGYWRVADSLTQDKDANGSPAGWKGGVPLTVAGQGATWTANGLVAVAAGDLQAVGKDRIPALVELQVCFTYPNLAVGNGQVQCTTNTQKKATQVTKLPHAFGDNYPTAEAGAGQIALTTGELNISATDVNVDAGNTGLSVSRTYSSYSGIGANSRRAQGPARGDHDHVGADRGAAVHRAPDPQQLPLRRPAAPRRDRQGPQARLHRPVRASSQRPVRRVHGRMGPTISGDRTAVGVLLGRIRAVPRIRRRDPPGDLHDERDRYLQSSVPCPRCRSGTFWLFWSPWWTCLSPVCPSRKGLEG
ncbi:hypothetical protein J2S98_004332 [Arthrobacter oryzae]|uniref:DNRLRE domain-containing protein n=1 Tax=Paenarthrobacter aurescens (strain TC1) TaxID=290340 RepID=A1R4I7_PAEAT|nr:hypothetical protein AAur_1369 [Paenarthrobacter aurescens TC1]MDP9989143.1 hypothetical protein [Arthrobacter oryzae]